MPDRDAPLPELTPDLVRAITLAGRTDVPAGEELSELHDLLTTARTDPVRILAKLLETRRLLAAAKKSCGTAAEAAERLQEIIEGLLDNKPLLCRVEHVTDGVEEACAICRVHGQLRELPVHPAVDVGELLAVEPWEYAQVDPDELIVTGVSCGADLLGRARGEIVEFKSYYDESREQALISRAGQGEEVVTLARHLCDVELAPSDRLVLLQGDGRWAIDRIPAERVCSRFEVPADRFDTSLDDLGGMDEIIDELLEDVSLRILNPDLRQRFALDPLRGMLLFSYKPGMGKTALVRALTSFLDELGREQGFDVALYVVKPNELKIVWHGGDAKLVREELCGAIRARQEAPRTRPLFILVVMDEIDSLGKRGGVDGQLLSSASNDAVQALLAEMDGLVPQAVAADGVPPAHVIWCGLTNRPDMLDEALKRPGRFGDFVREIPAADQEAAARILAIHGRGEEVPWFLEGEVRTGVSAEDLRVHVTRPAVAAVFDRVVLRYSTDARADVAVTAGEAMAGVHFKQAMNTAKKKAARREHDGVGVPAVALDDVLDGLVEQACAAARQMDADREMLKRQMRIDGRVTRVALVPHEELVAHRYVRNPVA